MSRVGIGLAGLGRMGRVHLGALTGRYPDARLACVYDANADVAAAAGAEFDVPWTASYDELLCRADAVAIASPPRTHAPLTIAVGTLATARIDAPHVRGVEWRTPGLASRDIARDFEERYPWAYDAELDAFARAVRGRTPPPVTGRDALAAFDLALAADESWRTGKPASLEVRA